MRQAVLTLSSVARSFAGEVRTNNTLWRKLKFRDIVSLHRMFGGDPDAHWIVEDFGLTDLNHVWKTTLWGIQMKYKQHQHKLVPYIIETTDGQAIGLAPLVLDEGDLSEGREVECSLILGKSSRGVGFYLEMLYTGIKEVLERKLIPVAWIDPMNTRSLHAMLSALGIKRQDRDKSLDELAEMLQVQGITLEERDWDGKTYWVFLIRRMPERIERLMVARTGDRAA